MKTSIYINSGDHEATFSVTIENMPVNNIRKLKDLPRQVAERLVDTIDMNSSEGGIEDREKFIQSLLGTE